MKPDISVPELITRKKVHLIGATAKKATDSLHALGLTVKIVSALDETTTLEYNPLQVRLRVDEVTQKVVSYTCG